MKMTKKALTAMIAVLIAATALPAAAMVSNLSNTLTSSNSTGANSAIPQAAPAAAPEGGSQTAAPAVQAEPSPESMFTTEDVDGGVAIIGFKTDDANFTDKVVVPKTIGGKEVVSLKNNNSGWNSCMTGADQITSIDTSL